MYQVNTKFDILIFENIFIEDEMAIIRPFNAVCPSEEVASLVASVPYDVVNAEEAAELARNNIISFLRVTRSEIEFDHPVDPYSPEVYEKAKANYLRLKSTAPMIQEPKPRFYIYRLIMDGHEQNGIAATFSVADYNNDVILKHEKTRKVKEDDRTNHIITTGAQTGPVFLTYRKVTEVDMTVEQTKKKNEPVYDFESVDGVRHTLWVIPEDYSDIIVFEIGKVQNLYIADGHHRAASASRAQKAIQEQSITHTGEEEYNFFIGVLFPADQLRIMSYNRVVYNLNGMSAAEFFIRAEANFKVTSSKKASPENPRQINMYLEGKWYSLKPNENVKPSETFGENLDVSILQNYLLKPLLGIEDPRTDENIDFIGGIRGTSELEKLVNSGKAKVAFSMYPVSLNDLMNISDAGEVMPPKSTWFEPKLRDGLLVHEI